MHFVGEKKFESVDLLVADGLIYLYIETRGADILQKLSEASNYEYSPYYRVRLSSVLNVFYLTFFSKNNTLIAAISEFIVALF